MDDGHIGFLLTGVAFVLAGLGAILSLIHPSPACICGCARKLHVAIVMPQGRLPHGGYCKVCSCRVYIAK